MNINEDNVDIDMCMFLFLLDGNQEDVKKCTCPAACNITHYDVQLSYSALTVSNINFYLGNQTQHIQQKYTEAQQTKGFLTSESVLHKRELFHKFVDSVNSYKEFMETFQDDKHPFGFVFWKKSLDAITSMLETDMDVCYGDQETVIEFYATNLAFEREWVVTLNEKLERVFVDVLMVIHARWSKPSDETVLRKMAGIVEESFNVIEQIQKTMVLYGSYGRFEGASNFRELQDSELNSKFPSVAVVTGEKQCKWQELYEEYSELEALLNELVCLQNVDSYQKCYRIPKQSLFSAYSGFDMRSTFYDETLKQLEAWQTVLSELKGCVAEYPTFLTEVQTWQQNLKVDFDMR